MLEDGSCHNNKLMEVQFSKSTYTILGMYYLNLELKREKQADCRGGSISAYISCIEAQ